VVVILGAEVGRRRKTEVFDLGSYFLVNFRFSKPRHPDPDFLDLRSIFGGICHMLGSQRILDQGCDVSSSDP